MAQSAQAILTLDESLYEAPHTSVLTDAWRRFSKSPSAIIGLVIIAILAIGAIFAPWLTAHRDPLAQNLAATTLAPSFAHPAGTDKLAAISSRAWSMARAYRLRSASSASASDL